MRGSCAGNGGVGIGILKVACGQNRADVNKCLLPLANTPLIEYTLEFLAMSGVTEIYVYCGAHTTEVERYLLSSKWAPTSPGSPFSLLEIIKSQSRSVGDAMRDLDARDLITGDFLLVHGDLISNLPIDAALSAHRARRVKDKNAIMTMVLRSAGTGEHRTKSQGITPVFVLDPSKERCLHYEEMSPLQANRYINIDPELLTDHTEMEIRTDLIDCGIDICTPDVLALWAESFDYEIPRKHFLHGVLKDYELNGKTIHLEIVDRHYAARVSNLQAYEAVSKDVLGRWTYPLVPDSNLLAGQSYKFERGGLCKEDGVILARSCTVGRHTVLGRGTSIGDGSVVSNSIIGRRCHIGKNVTIKDSYIWDDVVIDDGATIQRSIIANEAVVGRKSTIEPGALLSFGVRISENTVVPSGRRITRAKRRRSDIDGEPLARVAADPAIVGPKGEGYLFHDVEDDDDGDVEDDYALQNNLIYSTAHLNLSSSSISTLASNFSVSENAGLNRSRLSSFASVSEDEHGGAGAENFHHDAVAGILDTLATAGDFDSAKLEFMGLRLANDVTDHQVHRAIAVAFTKRIAQLVEGGATDAGRASHETFGLRGARTFVADVAIGRERRVADQVDFLLCAQKDLCHRASGDVILFAVLKELYELELVGEEAVLAWWADARGSEGDEMGVVRRRAAAFVQWLEEAEEEDSDSDDESGDEESD